MGGVTRTVDSVQMVSEHSLVIKHAKPGRPSKLILKLLISFCKVKKYLIHSIILVVCVVGAMISR